MRVLFFGDYSNLHACLAKELRKRGHEVCVISDGGRYMDTEKDILLDRKPGKAGAFLYLYKVWRLVPSLRGYDVVQLINPHFLHLKPTKLRYFFDILKRNNRSIFLTLAGDDYFFVRSCLDGEMFRFSEFKIGNTLTPNERLTHSGEKWTQPALKEYGEYVYENIDGAMSVLPEYDMAARPVLGDKVAFTNIPVDLEELPYSVPDISGKINIFIGIRQEMIIQKGTGILQNICKELEQEMPDKCSVTCVRNLPLKEYLRKMRESHIVLDQLYSYSPGTNGFQAMALGKATGTGAEPEYYRYINEPDTGAVIPLSPLFSPSEIKDRLRDLILNPTKIQEMGAKGRRLVAMHNDVKTVADKFIKHWQSGINLLSHDA